MKVIFSRKGFDGTAGGCPSPIVDGRPVSLPIPTRMPTPTRYGDLTGAYADLVSDLTKGRHAAESYCHLDPDITPSSLPRLPGWRGSLGQTSASQSHLSNQGIETGDLFLFWGLFRNVRHDGRWRFVGEREHRIWGWLRIGEIIDLGTDGSHALRSRPWLRDHPHVRPGWSAQNALYIASDELVLDDRVLQLPGTGVLQNGHRLTIPGGLTSTWRVPEWLNPALGGSGMTYHPLARWSADGSVRSAARGQEFVAAPKPDSGAVEWIAALLREAA